jgi:hypothetical protein
MRAETAMASSSTPGQLPSATAALVEHTSGPPLGGPPGHRPQRRFEEASAAEVIIPLASVSAKTDGLIRHFLAIGDGTPRGGDQPAIWKRFRTYEGVCDFSLAIALIP